MKDETEKCVRLTFFWECPACQTQIYGRVKDEVIHWVNAHRCPKGFKTLQPLIWESRNYLHGLDPIEISKDLRDAIASMQWIRNEKTSSEWTAMKCPALFSLIAKAGRELGKPFGLVTIGEYRYWVSRRKHYFMRAVAYRQGER